MVQVPEDAAENSISLRFKYGPQTVFLFANPRSSLSTISSQLLTALRERYPDGLVRNAGLPDRVPIPKEDEPFTVSYALPKNARDLAAGWKVVDAEADHSPTSLRLRENAVLAFVIKDGDKPAVLSEFHVDIPTFDDEEE